MRVPKSMERHVESLLLREAGEVTRELRGPVQLAKVTAKHGSFLAQLDVVLEQSVPLQLLVLGEHGYRPFRDSDVPV